MNTFANVLLNNFNIDLFSKKMKIKLGFISILFMMIIANVIFAWALPNISVECCEDFILNFIDRLIKNFNLNLNLLKSIPPFLLLQSDIIFLITAVKFILIKYDKRFLYILFSIWFIKFFTDWSFYQHNTHDNIELSKYSYYFITGQFIHRNSLFSFPNAIQFLCLLQLNRKSQNSLLIGIVVLNLLVSTITFLIMKLFFTFQIIFSFLIVHYLSYLIY
jgi:hypothetical protein